VKTVSEHDDVKGFALHHVFFKLLQRGYSGHVGVLEEKSPLSRDFPDPGNDGSQILAAMRLLPHGARVMNHEDGGVVLNAEPNARNDE
jgi:hypothetical protein